MAATGKEREEGINGLAGTLALPTTLSLPAMVTRPPRGQIEDEGRRRGRLWTTGQIAFLRRFVLYMESSVHTLGLFHRSAVLRSRRRTIYIRARSRRIHGVRLE